MGDIDEARDAAARFLHFARRTPGVPVEVWDGLADYEDMLRDAPELVRTLWQALAASEDRTRELEATVQRVEAPHKPYFPTAADEAWNTNQRCEECGQQFPCKTIRALRGSDV